MTTKQITEKAKEIVALQLSYGNKVSLKWAKDVITSSIAAFEKRAKEPLVSYESMIKRLKKDGRI